MGEGETRRGIWRAGRGMKEGGEEKMINKAVHSPFGNI